MNYFVCSNGDAPDELFFSFKAAKEALHLYIDVFDKNGKHVTSYKLQKDDTYTEDF
jgi:hypothetical protein